MGVQAGQSGLSWAELSTAPERQEPEEGPGEHRDPTEAGRIGGEASTGNNGGTA